MIHCRIEGRNNITKSTLEARERLQKGQRNGLDRDGYGNGAIGGGMDEVRELIRKLEPTRLVDIVPKNLLYKDGLWVDVDQVEDCEQPHRKSTLTVF